MGKANPNRNGSLPVMLLQYEELSQFSHSTLAGGIVGIRYKRGRCNCDADLLSRFPLDEADDETSNQSLCTRSFHQPTNDSLDAFQLNVVTRSKSKG